jgi:twitching motility protein PilT
LSASSCFRRPTASNHTPFEILLVNDAARNLIREGKHHQIDNILQTNVKQGMMPMDYCWPSW